MHHTQAAVYVCVCVRLLTSVDMQVHAGKETIPAEQGLEKRQTKWLTLAYE